MPTYATLDQFREFAPEYAPRSDADITAALNAAEGDVDDYVGFYPIGDNGRKFSPDTDDGTILQATCAQARYRLYMGPVFFIEQSQYRSVGGDVSTDGASRFGPEMKAAIPLGFRRLTGRFT